ncbi:MAG: histidine phosphatase family protein [Haliscomenobacteraceae bacterium CHB4]|nr:putative phosphoserine phosphatase 2 [Saprospiraceae bacterium]MCE7923405.1 histidine phosphatase family protein [Haliscomenobacteraceae bacterium CHB4]
MTLYILRHGETEYNRLGIVQGSGVDTELNDTGHEQARAFFENYQEVDFQLIVTSLLQRTHQTVRRFIEKEIPWIQTSEINEISWGDHEGQPATPERTIVYQHMINEWRKGNLDASLPNGETARQLAERVGRFVEWLKTRPAEKMLVATHGRTMRCLIAMLKGLKIEEMEGVPHANTGLYVIHFQNDEFVFERENDTSHLMEHMMPHR